MCFYGARDLELEGLLVIVIIILIIWGDIVIHTESDFELEILS